MKAFVKTFTFLLATCSSLDTFSQTPSLFVPNGTAGIGTSVNAGNIGIGTNAPTSPLQINGSVTELNLLIHNTSTNGARTFLTAFPGKSSLQTDKDFTIATNGGGWSDKFILTNGGRLGLGTLSPAAKIHIHEDASLAQPTGSYQLLSRLSGRSFNYFIESQWLLRDDNTSNNWTTARLHNGISIDDSFLQPGIDTRTWWERDPHNNIQSWGQSNTTYMTINAGNVGIGTRIPDAKLAVKGTVHAEEVKVDLSVPAPDYVFEKNYNLLSLQEVENYINLNKHLPQIPAAKEFEANGVNLGEMNMLLLKKVEELTLYMIEMKKENNEQQNQIENQQKQIDALTKSKN